MLEIKVKIDKTHKHRALEIQKLDIKYNVYVIGVPKGEEKKYRTEAI